MPLFPLSPSSQAASRTSSSVPPPAALVPRGIRLMPLVALLIAVLGGALGDQIRYVLIEPVARAAACVESPLPWWCALRDAIRIASQYYLIAGGAVVAAVAALFSKGRRAVVAIVIAMALGGMGVYLYSTALAVVAVVLGLLRAASLDRA